ncbi:Cytokine-Dependent Hematopoietic Cell Linker [Manis pentadactyla]|nr:Cytokine-Dependent Hematopoietic Cell Linker [Manis pentadactyla]
MMALVPLLASGSVCLSNHRVQTGGHRTGILEAVQHQLISPQKSHRAQAPGLQHPESSEPWPQVFSTENPWRSFTSRDCTSQNALFGPGLQFASRVPKLPGPPFVSASSEASLDGEAARPLPQLPDGAFWELLENLLHSRAATRI